MSATESKSQEAMKLLAFTPVCCNDPRHLEMVRVQTLLVHRMRRHMPQLEIVSGIVVDFCREELNGALAEIARSFDVCEMQVPEDIEPKCWGIRRPTNYMCSRVARALGCDHVLRVIQDTFIDDSFVFSQNVGSAIRTTGAWIGAHVDYWQTASHWALCAQMQLPFHRDLHYPQGAVMLAPTPVWEDFYVRGLPHNIHHSFDDVMMGVLLEARGGKFVDFPCTWSHRHHCESAVAQSVYNQHFQELGPAHPAVLPQLRQS
jgi:hypothetical protein